MLEHIPLIYLDGVERGRYAAIHPVYVVGDDPATLSFTIADTSQPVARAVGAVGEPGPPLMR